ncbi:conserved protein of unknown function [Magnetospirillum sp. XM-1]|uniref:hypothetical protein n=1 Tax=Magnetospirillum sp. XM-1 TaxID=1663591 RepID=UPI00073DF1B8|nr:hypothetical protein [Magnetospirillum sp. XM-1]CUW39634.1 conserved protein of unknown function [Magnetospirillum sp. XM-1]
MTARFRGVTIGQPLAPMVLEAGHAGPAVKAGRALFKFLRLGRPVSPLRLGDRFRKAMDQFDKVWEVVRIWTAVDGLLHVRLRCLDGQGETRIISAITLTDSNFFLPVPTLPSPD